MDLTENVAKRTAARQLTVNLHAATRKTSSTVATPRSALISPTDSCSNVNAKTLVERRSSLKGRWSESAGHLPRNLNRAKLECAHKMVSPMSVPAEVAFGRTDRPHSTADAEHLPFPVLSPSVAGECPLEFPRKYPL